MIFLMFMKQCVWNIAVTVKDNLDGFVATWTGYACNDSLEYELKKTNKKKTVIVRDRWSKSQNKKKDDSSLSVFNI